MPYRNGRLTPKEKLFADQMARTGDPVYSAGKAGYSTPETRGYELAHKPELQAETMRKRMMRLDNLVDLATDVVEKAMTDSTATWTNKLTAADMVLKRWEKAGEGSGGKEPSEMTADEIQRQLRALRIRQIEIGDEAIDVTPGPEPASVFD